MSYCLNPNCPNPADSLNAQNRICRHCGSLLVVRGNYRVKHLLGEGGFGKTFEVEDDRGSLKVLKILIGNNPKAVSLFQREAHVLGHLQHPGIPKVQPDGYFTFLPRNSPQPLHCLVMEKIEGSNLEEWLSGRANQPILQNQALIWLKQLAEILHQVHQQQYFHRDIKPSNIMLRPNGQLVLIDFGTVREVTGTYLAKVGGGGHKVTGIVSPGYTPPEQANGKAVPQSDFFALGRTFVYLLTGHDPNDFPESPLTGELMWRDRAKQVSKPVADLIDYLMAPFPGNRPQNTQVILQRLIDLERAAPQPQVSYQPAQFPANHRGVPQYRGAAVPLASLRRGKSKRRSATLANSKNKKLSPLHQKLVGGLVFLVVAGVGASLLFAGAGMEFYQYFPAQVNLPAASSGQREAVSAKEFQSDKAVRRPENLWKKAVFATTLADHLWGVTSVAISSDGQTLVSGSVDKTVKIWNLPAGKLLHTLTGHTNEVWSVAISPDGKTLASSSGDKTVKLWDLGTGTLKSTLDGHSGSVNTIAFSPDGKTLASGSFDSTVKLWNLGTGQVGSTLSGHAGGVNALAFSPDGRMLASGGFDSTVKLWDLQVSCAGAQACSPIQSLEGHSRRVQSVAFSPDGRTLASGSVDGSINVWDLSLGQLQRTFLGHLDAVNAVVITPDSKTVVSGGGSVDGTIKLWDLATGQLLATVKGHSDSIHDLALGPDGQTLASSSEDYTIKIWRLQ
ncbi:MAG: serine/threonine protein kinase [Microcoleus vaginatus WJT46-NPBG5]|nr:serine/threonine protein kinase [Microcoleus vaginatus WJT46-NPBG5]